MSELAQSFPLLVLLGIVVLAGLLIRLDLRLGRGALGPGPRQPIRPDPPGLRQTPWELESIQQQLDSSNPERRATLVRTVNQVVAAAGVTAGQSYLPPDATDQQIEAVVDQLERRLELPGLGPLAGPPGHHPPRADHQETILP